jgi:RimJ/RimL family protein N-acetyltransferase
MVGDVNLFFLDDDDDDDDEEEVEEDDEDDADAAEPSLPSAASASPGENSAVPSANVPSHTAEIMVMTAEATFRKRGFAKRAASMMMRYANETLGVTAFVAKISMSNKASLRLFRSELGFSVQKEVPAFEEIHLLLKAPKPGAVASTASGGWERVLALTDSWGVERFANPEALP